MQNIEKTILGILKKFEVLDDYEKRKIVFWYDKDKTVDTEEELEEIRIALAKNEKSIKLHVLNNNFFETKKLLEHDDKESNYLIYSPETERGNQSNWLLDIQLYSSRFENSKISDIKSEIGIEGYDHDRFLEKNIKFFAKNKRVSDIKKLYNHDWKEDHFVLGILAVLSRSSTIDQKEIVRNLLIVSLNEEDNAIWEKIVKFEFVESFWNIVNRHFGYSSEYPTLKKLFLSFIITHIGRNTKIALRSYRKYINRQSNECEIFIRGWLDHSKDSKQFDDYCRQLLFEADHKLEKSLTSLISKYDVEKYLEPESIDIFDKNIIRNIVQKLTDDNDDFDKYLEWIDKRKTKHWYQEYEHIYCAIENAVKLHQFSKGIKHEGINEQSLNELVKEYTNRYYLLDYHYRKFYYHYDKDSEKEILKKDIKEKVEKLYKKMLDALHTQWDELIGSELENTWNIELIDGQDRFYKNYVNKIIRRNDKDKVAVIISDALRYENAVELKDVLNKSTKGTMELKTMAGLLPSYTKLGMASLLPHNHLEYKNNHIFVDGINSEGTVNREKILINGYPDSVAFKFNELIEQKIGIARNVIRGKRVIYIYHNRIDDAGDKISSEKNVFDAVQSTIEDIDKMINRLGRSLNVTNIVVTSDHGFIYNREYLESIDKLGTNDFDNTKIIEANKRFILSEQDLSIKNTHKFSMDPIVDSDKKMYLYVPLGDLRFKSQGGGINYVHGGASLQEIIIPVLVYNHNRQDSDLDRKGIEHGKVDITVLDSHNKITSNSFKVKILQTAKVTDKREPLRCKIALYDSNEQMISDEKLFIADSISDEPEERIQEVILTLGSNIKNGICILKAIDEDTRQFDRGIFDISVKVDILITDDF
ncbi:MAG TPA: BREX-1 system phosphatase PglZ type A [Methanosarcinaceae archaeon]|nr:BREX-1 system phosphatase PglZ type A [Methanosarcinaceae archaeon]